jgi:hypothetical protein
VYIKIILKTIFNYVIQIKINLIGLKGAYVKKKFLRRKEWSEKKSERQEKMPPKPHLIMILSHNSY